MCKGDKHGDARSLCGSDHRDAFPLSGDCSPLTAPSSGLLRIDGLVSCSAYLNRMRRGGFSPRLWVIPLRLKEQRYTHS